jgi:predicted RNA-binding protein YlxR (DUF448 family)
MIDERQALPGRGAYVHRDAACQTAAVGRGGLARTLRTTVPEGLFKSEVSIHTIEDGDNSARPSRARKA